MVEELEGWEQTLTAGPLLLIAAAAIAALLVLIIKLKMHAFVALIIISFLTAVAAGIPFGAVVPVMLDGFGGTLASVAPARRILEVGCGNGYVLAAVARLRNMRERAPQVAQPVGLADQVGMQRDAHHQRLSPA